MNKVMVTGGAGYIGSHIVRKLAESGYYVLSLDKAPPLRIEHERIIEYTIDLKNTVELDKLFKENTDIECIIHCAGELGIKRSFLEKELFYSENVYAMDCLLNAMIQNKIHNIIFSSSAAVYPNSNKPLAEGTVLYPEYMSPYSLSKYIGEEKLRSISSQYGINYIAFRYFNIWGCDLFNPSIVKKYLEIDNILPNLINVSNRNNSIIINGNDYDTVDGTCVRDYLDVRELARLHIMALKRLTSSGWAHDLNGVYNAGSGNELSVFQLINIFNHITGASMTPIYAERRNGDASYLCANIEKTRKTFSWNPQINYEELISSLWNANSI
ncbi:MAG: NAD-dependent epimerase/dehydratase family protein [Ruminococcus sp.]|nr:NAD-dependent epimerase/dehydratase family protein [Ruminococcus sp.]